MSSKGHSLVMGLVSSGWGFSLTVLKVFSNLDDCTILKVSFRDVGICTEKYSPHRDARQQGKVQRIQVTTGKMSHQKKKKK